MIWLTNYTLAVGIDTSKFARQPLADDTVTVAWRPVENDHALRAELIEVVLTAKSHMKTASTTNSSSMRPWRSLRIILRHAVGIRRYRLETAWCHSAAWAPCRGATGNQRQY